MAGIKIRKTVREDKVIPDINQNHLVFTKAEDRIIISLDPKLCKLKEDREGLMTKLYIELMKPKTITAILNKVNKDIDIV